MTKGADHPVYAQWCRMATQQWPGLAADLEEETGYDVELEWTGGAIHAFGEEEFQTHTRSIETIKQACRKVDLDYPVQMLNRSEFKDLIPDIRLGEDVSGAMYASEQGHVNPLKVLTALRCAFQKKGGVFQSGQSVGKILPQKDRTVMVETSRGRYRCEKLVIAAGHGSIRLVQSLGEKLHIYPSRGQILVTERHRRLLKVPVLCVRQTQDGTFLIGYSNENTALDTRVTPEVMKNMAANAIRLFPELAGLNWIRSWGALRVMTPDGAPIYSRVPGHDNITVLALHSAVSLTPLKISAIAPWILGKSEAKQIHYFSNGRFNV